MAYPSRITPSYEAKARKASNSKRRDSVATQRTREVMRELQAASFSIRNRQSLVTPNIA